MEDGELRELLVAPDHRAAPTRRGPAPREPGRWEPARAGRAGAAGPGARRGRRPPGLARGADRRGDRRAEPLPATRCWATRRCSGRSFNPLVWRQLLADDGIEIDEGVTSELRRFVEFDPSGVGPVPPGRRPRRRVPGSAVPPSTGAAPPGRAGDGAAWPRGSVDSVADLLSVHFFEGGDLERAWRYARPRRFQRPGRPTPTSTPPRCTGGPSRPPAGWARSSPSELRATWTALGDVLEQAGLPDDAMDAYRRATALAGDDQRASAPGSCSSGPGPASGSAGSSLPSGSSAQPSGRSGRRPERRRRAGPGGRRRRCEPSSARARSSRAGPLRPPSERRQRPSASASCGELAKALNVIDWAHASWASMDQAVHHTADRRDPRDAGRAASSGGGAREPGVLPVLARTVGRGARLLPAGARRLRRDRRRRERGRPAGERGRAADQPRALRGGP